MNISDIDPNRINNNYLNLISALFKYFSLNNADNISIKIQDLINIGLEKSTIYKAINNTSFLRLFSGEITKYSNHKKFKFGNNSYTINETNLMSVIKIIIFNNEYMEIDIKKLAFDLKIKLKVVYRKIKNILIADIIIKNNKKYLVSKPNKIILEINDTKYELNNYYILYDKYIEVINQLENILYACSELTINVKNIATQLNCNYTVLLEQIKKSRLFLINKNNTDYLLSKPAVCNILVRNMSGDISLNIEMHCVNTIEDLKENIINSYNYKFNNLYNIKQIKLVNGIDVLKNNKVIKDINELTIVILPLHIEFRYESKIHKVEFYEYDITFADIKEYLIDTFEINYDDIEFETDYIYGELQHTRLISQINKFNNIVYIV